MWFSGGALHIHQHRELHKLVCHLRRSLKVAKRMLCKCGHSMLPVLRLLGSTTGLTSTCLSVSIPQSGFTATFGPGRGGVSPCFKIYLSIGSIGLHSLIEVHTCLKLGVPPTSTTSITLIVQLSISGHYSKNKTKISHIQPKLK